MAAVNRKCFRELTRSAPASPRRSLLCCLSYNLQSQARGTQEEQRSPLPSWSSPGGCGLPPLLSPFFWCYRVAQSQGALVILLVPNPICGATLGKSLSFSGPYFPLLKNELPPSTLLVAIQNSLVGGPILQNVLGTVTSVNQGLLGSGGLLGGGGLLSYGGVFGVVEEISG